MVQTVLLSVSQWMGRQDTTPAAVRGKWFVCRATVTPQETVHNASLLKDVVSSY